MKKIYSLLLFAGSMTAAYAQSWSNLNVPSPGGNLASIDKNNSYVYVTETTGGIHVSSNGGNSWSTVTTNYPAGQTQLFTCTNSGALLVGLMDFSMVNGTMFPLYKSTDNGTSWTFVNNSNVPTASGTFYHSPNNTIYFVPAYDGIKTIKKSTDDGLTWTVLTTVAKDLAIDSNNDIYGLIKNGSNNIVLQKSTDGASTWNSLTATGMMAGPDRIVLNSSGKLYVANNSSKVNKSTDFGTSFVQLDSIFPNLWADANGKLFGGKASVCALSSNDGFSWSNINTGFSNFIVNLQGFFAHPNVTVYGASNGYLYKFNSIPSGINNYSQLNLIENYPNPALNFITLKIEHFTSIKTVEIINLEGKIVKTLVNPENNTINISSLNEGVYFITVITDKTILRGKFTKLND